MKETCFVFFLCLNEHNRSEFDEKEKFIKHIVFIIKTFVFFLSYIIIIKKKFVFLLLLLLIFNHYDLFKNKKIKN